MLSKRFEINTQRYRARRTSNALEVTVHIERSRPGYVTEADVVAECIVAKQDCQLLAGWMLIDCVMIFVHQRLITILADDPFETDLGYARTDVVVVNECGVPEHSRRHTEMAFHQPRVFLH